MSLFIPAAVRYGIGADFFSYMNIYHHYEIDRVNFNIEPFMVAIIKILVFLKLPAQSLFVVYAFLTNFFMFLAIPKDRFYMAIPVYVLVFYLETYCVLRQILGCIIMFYAVRLFLEGKTRKSLIWCVVAFFNHKSLIITIAILFLSQLIPYVSTKRKFLFFMVYMIFLYLFSSAILQFVFEKVLGNTSYAVYAVNAFSTKETEINSGMGVLLRLLILSVFAFMIDKVNLSKKEYKLSVALLFAYTLFYFLNIKMYIFARLIVAIYFCIIVFFIDVAKSFSKCRKIALTFLFICYGLFFVMGIKNATVYVDNVANGRQINPYVTVWNYHDKAIIVRRAHNLGF